MGNWLYRTLSGGLIAFGAALSALAANAVAQDSQPLTLGGTPLSSTLNTPGLPTPLTDSSLATLDRSDGTSIKLGNGLSLTMTGGTYDLNPLGGSNALLDPLGRWSLGGPMMLNGPMMGAYVGPYVGPHLGPMTNFNGDYEGNYASSMGSKLSMDLGHGLSLDALGSVMRIPAAYGGPLGFSSGAQTWTGLGGGVTMNLGGGASISLIGGVSNTSGYSCGFPVGFCR